MGRRNIIKVVWRLLAKALGQKEGTTDKEADIVAGLRLAFVLLNVVTCCFIIANAIHHW